MTCDACDAKRRAEREAERFAKAKKLTDWDGWVWTDATSYHEGFFHDVDEMIEWFEEQGEDEDEDGPKLPPYAWACSPISFAKVELERILENIEEDDDAYEDFDRKSLNGVKELGEAIDIFNEANKHIVSYQPDGRAVLINVEGDGD